jgi:hypothetical protein
MEGLVEAFRYKQEGWGSIPNGVIKIFLIDLILPVALWPLDRLSLKQN